MKITSHLLLALALSCATLSAKQPAPAQPPAAQPIPDERPDTPRQVSICYEAFSLESADGMAVLRSGLEGSALYDKIVEKVAKKEAIQETLIVLRSRSGGKALVEGISENIYPTEYEPPSTADPNASPAPAPAPKPTDVPANGTPPIKTAPQPTIQIGGLPATPTSFETRNTGWSFEMEATLGSNSKVIDLRFVPTYTVKTGTTTTGQGLSQTEMPLFDSQSVSTALTLEANKPFFIGTMSRSLVSQANPTTAKRVWLTFVTPRVVTASDVVQ